MATIEIGSGYACVPSRACVPPSTLVGPQSFRNKDVPGVCVTFAIQNFLPFLL